MIAKSFQQFQLIGSAPADFSKGKSSLPGMKTGAGKSFGAVFGKMLTKTGGADAAALESRFPNLKALKGEEKGETIEMLLENLQLDGMVPEAVDVDSKGLEIIEQLLGELGFGEETIDSFISDLTDGGEKNEISLSGLLTKLSSFLESAKTEDTFSMETTPAVESLLTAMGVKPSEIETLFFNAESDEGGLNLQELITGLKTIAEKGVEHPAGGRLELNSGNQMLLAGLGVEVNGKKTLSIDEFIEKLETLVDGKKAASGDESPAKVVAGVKNGALNGDSPAKELAKSFGEHIQAGIENKNIQNNQKNTKNSLLDNHSFQKQQHALEENFNPEVEGFKHVEQLKPGQAKFVIKDGAIIMNEKTAQPGAVNKTDDSAQTVVRAGVTTDPLAGKTAETVVRASSERSLPSYVTNQVSMKIANAAKNGETAFKIQIKPPEMGRLQISLDFTNNGLKVGILAEHTATRDMLLANSSELKTILADQGIRLDKVQVDVSGDFQQSMADARNESGQSGKKQDKQEEGESKYDRIAAGESVRLKNETVLRPETGRLSLVV